jgi:antitoxin (DNA-binding transcriptional repressor) of toxin-antitoxin stability system
MSEAVVTVEDAAVRLAELVDHVSAKREATVILKAGRPVARIVPIPPPGEVSEDLIDSLRRWRTQYPESDEHLAEVIVEARRGVKPAHDAWM